MERLLGALLPPAYTVPKLTELSEQKAAADRLSQTLADVHDEELVEEFKGSSSGTGKARRIDVNALRAGREMLEQCGL